jgi:D-sedoheptulose 7-phosphate isomerase
VQNKIASIFEAHRLVINKTEQLLLTRICDVVQLLAESLLKGKKILIMGNGGSAADAQHFAAEIVGRFYLERPALPAIALSTDTSILTAIGNDYGFDQIFKRQVEAHSVSGDVLIGISTSGSSKNVLEALLLAKERGCKTVAFLGRDGGIIAPVVDIPLIIPSTETPRIQEAHVTLIHIVCELLEKKLFGGNI